MWETTPLRTLSSSPLSTAEREALRQHWLKWQSTGTGYRELSCDGEVVEYPLTRLDMTLAASLASLGPCQVTRLLGEVMNTAQPIRCDILYWRLECMAEEGKIHYLKDEHGNRTLTATPIHTP
ncbi:DUF3658 domain-containing protein [Aeromonas hydrophila]|uniref:DUF3658 domain-containing protein n=1 Tax=Aeromonas hydrophila TaxID=644 RepID=UPI0038CF975B